MSNILDLIAPFRKAIVAFIVGALVTYLAKHGVDLNMTVRDFIEMVVSGSFTFVTVFFTKNTPKK